MNRLVSIFVMALFVGLSFSSCKEDDEIGCEAIRFERSDFAIGAEGGMCLTYEKHGLTRWWLIQVNVDEIYNDGATNNLSTDILYKIENMNDEITSFSNDVVDIKKDGYMLTVTMQPNQTGNERLVEIEVGGLVGSDRITITQAARKK